MKKLFHKALALVLTLAVMLSCLVTSAVFTTSAEDTTGVYTGEAVFDFSDASQVGNAFPSTGDATYAVTIEDETLRITTPKEWQTARVRFPFELEAGKSYVLSFKYKVTVAGNYRTQVMAGKQSSDYGSWTIFGGNSESNNKLATAMDKALTPSESWSELSVNFVADENIITDEYKYLGLYIQPSVAGEIYIDDVVISEAGEFDFSSDSQVGNAFSADITDEALRLYATSGSQSRARLLYTLENEKEYKISLKYKAGVEASYDLRFYAAKASTNYGSWTIFGGNDEKNQLISTAFAKTLSADGEWVTAEYVISPGCVTEEYRYLGLWMQPAYDDKTTTCELYIDDLIITEPGGAIILNYNDGVTANKELIGYNVGDTVTLPTPTREGYDFDGWYSDAELTNAVGKSYTVSENNVNLYAKWSESALTKVLFDFSDSTHLDYGFSAQITDESLVMSTGSYQQSRARLPFVPKNGNTYKLTLDYKADFPDVVTTLSFTLALNYAANKDVWSLLGTEKKLVADGGTRIAVLTNTTFSGDTDWQTVTCYFTVPDSYPVNSDSTVTYNYLGFWMQPGATEATVSIDNISIEKMDGSIAFDTGCDIAIDDLLGSEGSIAELPAIQRLGYSFEGWYFDQTFENKAVEVVFPAEGNITTLYAKWTALPAAETPAAPEIDSIVNNRVVLKATDGYEYSLDGEIWQTAPYFDGLFSGKEYTFYQRAAASYTAQTSAASEALTFSFSVLGDTNADSTFNSIDLANLRKYLLGFTENLYFEGCDVNSDEAVSLKDLIRYKKIMVDYTVRIEDNTAIPSAGEYDFCDDPADENSLVTVTGIDTYLNVTSGTIWNGLNSGSDSNIRTNEYIFLPKGSTLNSDTSYKVYYYNADFAWKSDWYTGSKINGTNPSAVTGTSTVNQDCFARLVSYSTDINSITIKIPQNRINDFYVFDSKSNAAFSYCAEMYNTLSDYARIVTEGAVNYMFITDLHYGDHTDAVKRQLKEMVLMIETLNSDNMAANDIDFIVLGGDITTGMFSSLDKLEAAVNEMLEPLNDCNVPVMILRGNHDDNSYYYSFATIDGTVVKDTFTTAEEKQAFIDETVMSEDRWKSFMLDTYASDDNSKEIKTYSRVHDSKNPDSAYYYYDFPNKKTRVICLDSIDYGTATPTTLGTNWYGYGLGQLNWLVTEAMTADSDWNYIFLSHMGYDVSIQTSDPIYHNLDILQNIMLAFQNRTSYDSGKEYTYTNENGDTVSVAIACDYTDLSADDGYILSYEFGHHHTDARYYDEEMNIANMNIGTSGQYSEGTEVVGTVGDLVSRTPIRASYTKTEALFDLVSVNKDIVYELRFGAGDDVIFNLKCNTVL